VELKLRDMMMVVVVVSMDVAFFAEQIILLGSSESEAGNGSSELSGQAGSHSMQGVAGVMDGGGRGASP
jgi:hypothetical protein